MPSWGKRYATGDHVCLIHINSAIPWPQLYRHQPIDAFPYRISLSDLVIKLERTFTMAHMDADPLVSLLTTTSSKCLLPVWNKMYPRLTLQSSPSLLDTHSLIANWDLGWNLSSHGTFALHYGRSRTRMSTVELLNVHWP